MNALEQIAFGQCKCGKHGQLFRTGKCAHCYIAELEQNTEPEGWQLVPIELGDQSTRAMLDAWNYCAERLAPLIVTWGRLLKAAPKYGSHDIAGSR